MRKDTPGAVAWAKKPRKPLAPRSKKGAVQAMVWAAEKAAHLAVEPTCQFLRTINEADPTAEWFRALQGAIATRPPVCSGPLDVHHIVPRGMGGRRGEAGPKRTLCRTHHQWVEGNRALAKHMGLLMRRT